MKRVSPQVWLLVGLFFLICVTVTVGGWYLGQWIYEVYLSE